MSACCGDTRGRRMKKREEHIKEAALGICACLHVILRVNIRVCVCARAPHAYVAHVCSWTSWDARRRRTQ